MTIFVCTTSYGKLACLKELSILPPKPGSDKFDSAPISKKDLQRYKHLVLNYARKKLTDANRALKEDPPNFEDAKRRLILAQGLSKHASVVAEFYYRNRGVLNQSMTGQVFTIREAFNVLSSETSETHLAFPLGGLGEYRRKFNQRKFQSMSGFHYELATRNLGLLHKQNGSLQDAKGCFIQLCRILEGKSAKFSTTQPGYYQRLGEYALLAAECEEPGKNRRNLQEKAHKAANLAIMYGPFRAASQDLMLRVADSLPRAEDCSAITTANTALAEYSEKYDNYPLDHSPLPEDLATLILDNFSKVDLALLPAGLKYHLTLVAAIASASLPTPPIDPRRLCLELVKEVPLPLAGYSVLARFATDEDVDHFKNLPQLVESSGGAAIPQTKRVIRALCDQAIFYGLNGQKDKSIEAMIRALSLASDKFADKAIAYVCQRLELKRSAIVNLKAADLTKPTVLFVHGATGHLAYQKILPELFLLWRAGVIPPNTLIVAAGRDRFLPEGFASDAPLDWSVKIATQKYLALMWEKMNRHTPTIKASWSEWCAFNKLIKYTRFDTEHTGTVRDNIRFLKEFIPSPDCVVIDYLATPPPAFPDLIDTLNLAGRFNLPSEPVRIVVEKPFETSATRAADLLEKLDRYSGGSNVSNALDHYTQKPTIKNAKRYLEPLNLLPLWNKDHIKFVECYLDEDNEVGDRLGYFKKAGTGLDMLQNHAFVALLNILIDPATDFTDSRAVEAAQLKLMQVFRLEANAVVLAQYRAGRLNGQDVSGFVTQMKNSGVAEESLIETFAAIAIRAESGCFEGVPIVLKSGKALNRKEGAVVVHLNADPSKPKDPCKVVFEISPKSRIIVYNNDGTFVETSMPESEIRGIGAYGEILLAMFQQDRRSFASPDWLTVSHRIISEALAYREQIAAANGGALPQYRAGGPGPVVHLKALERKLGVTFS